uniref:Lipoprotein n=1 Tax=Geobacter metallireducens TaxID=28232 RepID=A0A831U0G7_GEOME
MVSIVPRVTRRAVLCSLSALLVLLAATGCGPKPQVSVSPSFRPAADVETAYVVPFAGALVPEEFSAAVFNDFVDQLNGRRRETGIRSFAILKDEVKDVDAGWLARQYYISGDIWSYVEDSGCCSTNIRVKARVYVYEPGKSIPSVEIFVPVESFFDHDRTTIERERDRLARTLARDLSRRVIEALLRQRSPSSPIP